MKVALRLFFIFSLLFFSFSSFAQQTIQLFQEDFNLGNNSFTLNSGGPGSASGPNKWIVNNEYNGNGIYPNTTPESNTFSGTIAQAPTSPYLHVHDEQVAPGTANCNYSNTMMSDNFTYMSSGFCTIGLTDIKFTYFYLAEGAATDFRRVYYSLDGGGSWVQCGLLQYNNTTLWKYEIITDPIFENQQDVRFGFRWTNTASAGANTMSYGIDDVIAVGTYDNLNPVEITVGNIQPNPVCEGNNVSVTINLSSPLCDGMYSIALSNGSGSFLNPTLWNIPMFAGQLSATYNLPMPNAVGGCYQFRVDRIEPPPAITGIVSGCIQVIDCPNTITTLQPAVTLGPDTVCDNSVIDVPFFSTGGFNNNNVYTAQLSDANGSFANPQIIGSSPDPATYDPALGSPPGSVGGLIPVTAPGCNYYIRIVSSSPAVIPPPANYFGPFCIRQCDVQTNNMQDISVCITPEVGIDTTITLDINSWNNNASYGPGNQFLVQVLFSNNYTVANTGSLGTVTSTTATTLTLSIPGANDLAALYGMLPNMYYLRLIPTNSNSPSDTLGTLIRLTIGVIYPPAVVTPDDSLICAGDLLSLSIFPFDYNSSYQWSSAALNNGQPFFWNYNPLSIQFNPQTPVGTYSFSVRQENNGCFSPWSDTVSVDVITTPNVNITAPTPLCVGDTIDIHVQFLSGTYYEWTSTGGDIIDTSNNIIRMLFDSAATYNIHVYALNECGSNQNNKNIVVKPKPIVVASVDTAICEGSNANLSASSPLATTFTWTLAGAPAGTGSNVTVTPDSTSEYIVTTATAAGCKDKDTVIVSINPNPTALIIVEDITCHDGTNGEALAIAQAGSAPFTYLWSFQNDSTSELQNLAAGDYTVTITDANGCSAFTTATVIEPGIINIDFDVTPATYGNNDAGATTTISGGTYPYDYLWSTVPPEITPDVHNLPIGTYSVTVSDANGCTARGDVILPLAENGIFLPGFFSPNGDGINDEFDFGAVNLASIEIAIFNRWGQRIWYSTSMKKRWNGTNINGAKADLGVYVYYIKGVFLDGKEVFQKGNLTLIR